MFSKLSRYRSLSDVVATDAQGRALPSKAIRLAPVPEGRVQHVIQDQERLDHLAYRYYRQSRHWWHICDANPAFLSPLDLMGQSPRTLAVFVLEWSAPGPIPWAPLVRDLSDDLGVETFYLGTEARPVPEVNPGQTIWEATALFNAENVTAADLATRMEALGFTVPVYSHVGRVGKPLLIPNRP